MRRHGTKRGRVAVGHPIDVASGEFFAVEEDYELPGIIPLPIGRTYNTQFLGLTAPQKLDRGTESTLPFGLGWRPSWLHELRATLTGFAYTKPDGTELHIDDSDGALDRTGRLLSVEHGIDISKSDNSRLRVVGYGYDREEHSFLFEHVQHAHYRLIAIERTSQTRIDFLYDPSSGLLTHLVQRREQRAYGFNYSQHGHIDAIGLRLANGSTRELLRYEYDAKDQLLQVTDERGLAARYLYDEAGRMIREEKRGGSVYTIRYDRMGRSIYAAGSGRYEERSLQIDATGRKTSVQDSYGRSTLYEWNAAGQVIKTTSPCGEVCTFTFDDLGRPTTETDANGLIQEITYDAEGHIVQDKSPGGVAYSYTYDERHRLTEAREVDPTSGSVLLITRLDYDEDDNNTRVQDNDDPPWRYEFSQWGEIITVHAPSGASSHHSYDELGGPLRSTNFDGGAWTWTCDVLGRLQTETDPLGNTWRVEYLDDAGLSTRLIEPDGRTYSEIISRDGRIVRQQLPGDRIRQIELSFCGLLESVTDEDGAVTRLTWGTEPGELKSIVNANGDPYYFGYDADLRLVSRRTFDGRVLRTHWEGDRKATTWDAEGRQTTYRYDTRGRLHSREDPDGETIYSYDPRGFVTNITSPSSTLELERDSRGRVTAERRDGIRASRTLDVMGLPTSQSTQHGSHASYAWTASGFLRALRCNTAEVRFDRDATGREVRRHLGGAGIFEQSYDPVGRIVSQSFRSKSTDTSAEALAAVTRHFAYDARGFLSSIDDSLRGPTGLLHNGRGDLTGVVRAGGTSEFNAFDACRNRTRSVHTTSGPALASTLQRARPNRNVNAVDLDSLAAAVVHTSAAFTHGVGDRLLTVSRVGRTIELRFDVNGQVVEKTVSEGADRATWLFRWNAQGELVGLTTPSGHNWSYRYDPVGRRIEKRREGLPRIDESTYHDEPAAADYASTWTYVWLGDELLETIQNGVLVESYYAEPGGDGTIIRDDGAPHFVLPDQIDSPSEEVDLSGRLLWASQKDPWGRTNDRRGVTGGEVFVGQWVDPESGLHYNRFRYYDPDCGRYLSPDPIDLLGGLNLYSSISDPFSDYDPDGLTPTTAPNYALYHIVDTQDNNRVVYVGITYAGPNGTDVSRRRAQHQRSTRLDEGQRYKLERQKFAQPLTYAQARGYEQADIAYYKTLKPKAPMGPGAGNRIRSYNPLRKGGKWRLKQFRKHERERMKGRPATCPGY